MGSGPVTMTILLTHGDLLKQNDVDAIVNTVNRRVNAVLNVSIRSPQCIRLNKLAARLCLFTHHHREHVIGFDSSIDLALHSRCA